MPTQGNRTHSFVSPASLSITGGMGRENAKIDRDAEMATDGRARQVATKPRPLFPTRARYSRHQWKRLISPLGFAPLPLKQKRRHSAPPPPLFPSPPPPLCSLLTLFRVPKRKEIKMLVLRSMDRTLASLSCRFRCRSASAVVAVRAIFSFHLPKLTLGNNSNSAYRIVIGSNSPMN